MDVPRRFIAGLLVARPDSSLDERYSFIFIKD
jgi:hypothetical protein